MKRKEYATSELLGGLSDNQLDLLDIIIQSEDLRDATQLTNLSYGIMGADPLYLKTYDGSAGWEARANLLKQLKEASPEKTDAELAEQLKEMETL